MSVEIIIAIVGVCTAPISSFVTWLLTRKKEEAEVNNTIIESMKLSLEFYLKISDDNKTRLEEVLKRNDDLDKRNEALEKKNDALEKEVNELRKQVFTLMNSLCLNLSCQLRVKAPEIKELKNEVIVKENC